MKLIHERTTERNLDRGVRFLRTLSLAPEIYSILASRAGYTPEEHERGWSLGLYLMGQKSNLAMHKAEKLSPLSPADYAMALLDDYDGPAFTRSRAALEDRYADQNSYLLGGLSASTGGHAVATTQTFLDRYRALKDGTDPERGATRDDDRKAMTLLEERHIVDDETEAQLRLNIEQAQQAPKPLVNVSDPKDAPEYVEAAYGFHVWLKDWRAQARAVIERRDYRIRLGLSSPRSSKSETDSDSDPSESETED